MSHAPNVQAPGVTRRRVGELTVTALSDGFLDISFELLSGIIPTDAEGLLRAAGQSALPRMNINTYIVQGPTRTILIDSGAGGINGWGGRLPVALAAAGVDPTKIDTILLTHAHPDHIGGMATVGKTRLFPNVQEVFLHSNELEFWRNDSIRAQAPDGFKPFFDVARNALDAYDDRLHPFSGEDVLPGVAAVQLHGHTPGHTGYVIESQGQSLLIWGDIFHFPEVQVARPEVTIAFDNDATQAAKARAHILDRASSDGLLIGGMHLNAPNFVRIGRTETGYRLDKEPWSPALV